MSQLIDCGFKVNPFLTEEKTSQSLTSTSANHLADLAKAAYERLENLQQNVTVVNQKFQAVTSPNVASTTPAVSFEKLSQLFVGNSLKIAEYKTFCAWVREAIKKKEELGKAVEDYISPELRELQANAPTYKESEQESLNQLKAALEEAKKNLLNLTRAEVKEADEMFSSEAIDNFNIKMMYDYLAAQTKAAVFGKCIHENGSLKKIKQEAMFAEAHPMRCSSEDDHALIITRELNVPIEDIEDLEMKIQGLQRGAQQTVNSILFTEVTSVCNEHNQKELDRYKQECSDADAEYQAKWVELNSIVKHLRESLQNESDRLYDEYTLTRGQYSSRLHNAKISNQQTVKELREVVRDLRIIIPNDLKSTFEYLKSLEK